MKLELAEVDPALPLKVKINHRSPGREKTHVMLFDPNDNKYVKLAKMERSYDFITTSYRLGLEDTQKLYSYFDHLKQPIMLKLSFQGGVSDIHSIKLVQRSSSEKKVLQSVILGDRKSEEQSEKIRISLPETSNEWSEPETLMPRVSFSSFEPISSMTSDAIEEIRLLEGKAKTQAFKRLIEDQTAPFSDRLNVAVAAIKYLEQEKAISLLFSLIRDTKISSSDRLKIAKVAEHIGEDQGVFLLSSLIKDQEIPFSDRLEVASFVGESAFFKLARDAFNGPENRALAVKHLKGAMKIIADRELQEDGDYTVKTHRGCCGGASSSS